MEEKRYGDRHQPLPDVQAVFQYHLREKHLTARASRILDISDGGCCFNSGHIVNLRPGQTGKLKLQLGPSLSEEIDAKIERIWEDGAAVSFKTPIMAKKYYKKEAPEENSHSEKLDAKNSLPNKQDDKTFKTNQVNPEVFASFAQADYSAVHNEIIDIKSCRTNIFTGTLGLLSAAAIAVLTIWGSKNSLTWVRWLPFASLVPLMMLSAAIISTIHKARGINKREGYLEVLGEYILKNISPLYYSGWFKANRVNDICRQISRINKKEGNPPGCPKHFTNEYCIDYAKKLIKKVADKTESFPAMLDNFSSLAMYLYSITYLLCLTVLLLSGFYALKDLFSTHVSYYWYIGAIVVGIIPSSIVILRLYKESKEWKITHLLSYLAIVVPIGALIWYFVYSEMQSYGGRWHALGAYCCGVIPSTVFGYMGYSYLKKLKSLRRGRYSLERWRYVWQFRFSNCALMAEETQISK